MRAQAVLCRQQYLSRMGALMRARRDVSLELLDTLSVQGVSSSSGQVSLLTPNTPEPQTLHWDP